MVLAPLAFSSPDLCPGALPCPLREEVRPAAWTCPRLVHGPQGLQPRHFLGLELDQAVQLLDLLFQCLRVRVRVEDSAELGCSPRQNSAVRGRGGRRRLGRHLQRRSGVFVRTKLLLGLGWKPSVGVRTLSALWEAEVRVSVPPQGQGHAGDEPPWLALPASSTTISAVGVSHTSTDAPSCEEPEDERAEDGRKPGGQVQPGRGLTSAFARDGATATASPRTRPSRPDHPRGTLILSRRSL